MSIRTPHSFEDFDAACNGRHHTDPLSSIDRSTGLNGYPHPLIPISLFFLALPPLPLCLYRKGAEEAVEGWRWSRNQRIIWWMKSRSICGRWGGEGFRTHFLHPSFKLPPPANRPHIVFVGAVIERRARHSLQVSIYSLVWISSEITESKTASKWRH